MNPCLHRSLPHRWNACAKQTVYQSPFVKLQVLDDSLGAGELKVVLGGLQSSVRDLAVVEDDGVTLGTAFLVGPADALGELGLGVGKEELDESLVDAQWH
jgi:hypothetical protein